MKRRRGKMIVVKCQYWFGSIHIAIKILNYISIKNMKLEMRYFYLNGNYDHEKTQCLNDTFFIQSFQIMLTINAWKLLSQRDLWNWNLILIKNYFTCHFKSWFVLWFFQLTTISYNKHSSFSCQKMSKKESIHSAKVWV